MELALGSSFPEAFLYLPHGKAHARSQHVIIGREGERTVNTSDSMSPTNVEHVGDNLSLRACSFKYGCMVLGPPNF